MILCRQSTTRLSVVLCCLLTISGLPLARGQQSASAPEASSAATPAAESNKDKESQASQSSNANESSKEKETSTAKDKRAEARNAEKAQPKPVIRLLELSGQYVDSQQPLALDPTSLLLGGESLKQKSFYRLCSYLEEIAKETQVAHVVFDLSDANLSLNPAQLDELARRLDRLKASGKQTIAWLENPSNVHLSVAAACSQVILADFGVVDMPSLAMQSLFYRDAMDLVGVQASVVRAGDFKGAVEPYLNPHMSEHLKQHYIEMLQSINDAQVDRLARGRGLTVAQVRQLQQKRLLLPQQALAEGLVDRLAPYGSMKSTIDEVIGKSLEWTKPKAAPKRDVSLFDLFGKLMSSDKKTSASTKEGTLAVLHLSGTIEDGKKESSGSIVSGPTVKTIEEIAKDDKIKGVVVRINSPGGSATASEAIRRALVTLTEKKPTVVSMGEMAASGGYWISCIGQPVYAEKGTITGSIGVFSLKLSLGTMLRRVGVHVESIALDDSAKSDSLDRPWSDRDVSSMQSFVDDVYGKFLKLVSQSRSIPQDQLQSLAGGRVWSGTQAKQHRLIDEIGGLDDCLAAVAKKAKLDKYEIIHRPIAKSGFDLMELLGEDDPNEIALGSLIPAAAVQWATSQGLNLRNTTWLLRQSMRASSKTPQVWALSAEEISIR